MEAVLPTTSALTFANRLDHFLARWGYKRGEHRVEPGLYRLGNPDEKSPVFVTANYTLSFDALREALHEMHAYILVLDTFGVNVWCAAGKGTFSTDELVRRLEECHVKEVISHRVLILPQLGAPGISAHEVKKRTHFKVEYGPVRAADLPAYMKTRRATPDMRKVTFTLKERMAVMPMEVVQRALPFLAAALALWLLAGSLAGLAVLATFVTATMLFPFFLPWLPTRRFSVKGFVLGGLIALAFAAAAWINGGGQLLWQPPLLALAFLSGIPAATAYIALNFTGSTPLTSHTGVEAEMRRFIRVMAGMGILSLICLAVYIVFRFAG